jgi:hypothetical protein
MKQGYYTSVANSVAILGFAVEDNIFMYHMHVIVIQCSS